MADSSEGIKRPGEYEEYTASGTNNAPFLL